jgi:hypothetical protein
MSSGNSITRWNHQVFGGLINRKLPLKISRIDSIPNDWGFFTANMVVKTDFHTKCIGLMALVG